MEHHATRPGPSRSGWFEELLRAATAGRDARPVASHSSTGVSNGLPAKCALRLSITNWPMAPRVSNVAVP